MRQGLPLQKEVRDQPGSSAGGRSRTVLPVVKTWARLAQEPLPQRGRTALANASVTVKILPVKSWDRDMARGWRQGQSDWKH